MSAASREDDPERQVDAREAAGDVGEQHDADAPEVW